MEYVIIYMLLGSILSVIMYMTSKKPLPIRREIVAHTIIAFGWPLVLINIGRLAFKDTNKGL